MSHQEFMEIVREQFLDEDPQAIQIDSQYRSLASWDSLTSMAIVVALEEKYGVQIEGADIKKMNTFSDLYDYVAARKS